MQSSILVTYYFIVKAEDNVHTKMNSISLYIETENCETNIHSHAEGSLITEAVRYQRVSELSEHTLCYGSRHSFTQNTYSA